MVARPPTLRARSPAGRETPLSVSQRSAPPTDSPECLAGFRRGMSRASSSFLRVIPRQNGAGRVHLSRGRDRRRTLEARRRLRRRALEEAAGDCDDLPREFVPSLVHRRVDRSPQGELRFWRPTDRGASGSREAAQILDTARDSSPRLGPRGSRFRIPLGTPPQPPGMTWHSGKQCRRWAQIWAEIGVACFVSHVHRATTCGDARSRAAVSVRRRLPPVRRASRVDRLAQRSAHRVAAPSRGACRQGFGSRDVLGKRPV